MYYKEKFNLSKKPGKLAELELSIKIVVRLRGWLKNWGVIL